MKNTLLVTGELAEEEVKRVAAELAADVLVLPVTVAQFMTPSLAKSKIKSKKADYKRIIFPGLVSFDLKRLEEELGTPCYKGTRNPRDLKRAIAEGKLSKEHAADRFFEREGKAAWESLVAGIESRPAKMTVGSIKIGPKHPPRIIAEIVDAAKLGKEESLRRAQYYIDSGADIIDVGATAGEDNSKVLAEIVSHLKEELNVAVSIDSLNPKEINACIDSGTDLVLSLDTRNMAYVTKKDDVAYVVIAFRPGERLAGNLKEAKKLGFEKLIADPILAPPFNIMASLALYHDFRAKDEGFPLMMGVGNVVELMDVDSIGLNGLLASLAVELSVSLLLTTENSEKTRNSVKELKRAIEMNFFAKERKSLPKDLGFDLLLAKSKSSGEVLDLDCAQVVEVSSSRYAFKEDPKGYFRIAVDFDSEEIIAAHHDKSGSCGKVYKGVLAEGIAKRAISDGLISSLEHASYLGRELEKAEIYLKMRKSYVQDELSRGL